MTHLTSWRAHLRKSGVGLAAVAVLSFIPVGSGEIVSAQEGPDGSQRVMRLASSYQVVPNLVYRTASGVELMLDLYQPSGLQAPNPTVMFFHLGGWTQGTKESAVMSLLPWMDMGFSILNVEYRLTDKALAPAAVEDARCALRWVYRNQKQYNLDVTKIVTTGQSAGGHLAMMTALVPASAGLDNTCPGDRNGNASNTGPNNTEEMKVAAIVDQYGVADVSELLAGPNVRTWAVAWLGPMSSREELAKLVSPTTYVKSGMPPLFSVHGDQDPTVPYALKQKFHQTLEKAGVAHELFTVPGGRHGGWNAADNVRLYAAVRAFLTKHGVMADAKTPTSP
jgi:acetyl esterase/lipase